MRVCSVDGCDGKLAAKGLCYKHYQRVRFHGSPHIVLKEKVQSNGKCKVDGCESKHLANGFCSSHYQRIVKYGNPLGGRTFESESHKWVLENLDYSLSGCLIYPYGISSSGYGHIQIDRKMELVHVIMCTIKHGQKQTSEHEVAHSCGVKACVNPTHLRWATRSENMNDKIKHGTATRGERHNFAVLQESDVFDILSDSRIQIEIAEDYGVTRETISCIKTGKSWGWLTGIVYAPKKRNSANA